MSIGDPSNSHKGGKGGLINYRRRSNKCPPGDDVINFFEYCSFATLN